MKKTILILIMFACLVSDVFAAEWSAKITTVNEINAGSEFEVQVDFTDGTKQLTKVFNDFKGDIATIKQQILDELKRLNSVVSTISAIETSLVGKTFTATTLQADISKEVTTK